MSYKRMVEEARQKGIASEKAMYASIGRVDDMLELMKESHPEEYWAFIRHTHEDLYGCHYNEKFASYDIEQMHSTDKEGKVHHGAHWSKDDVVTAWQGKVFPQGTTDCDKWVAANAIWNDLHKHYNDSDILDIAFLFFFADEDYEGNGKVWKYMHMQ